MANFPLPSASTVGSIAVGAAIAGQVHSAAQATAWAPLEHLLADDLKRLHAGQPLQLVDPPAPIAIKDRAGLWGFVKGAAFTGLGFGIAAALTSILGGIVSGHTLEGVGGAFFAFLTFGIICTAAPGAIVGVLTMRSALKLTTTARYVNQARTYYVDRNTMIRMLESGALSPAEAIQGIYAAAPRLAPPAPRQPTSPPFTPAPTPEPDDPEAVRRMNRISFPRSVNQWPSSSYFVDETIVVTNIRPFAGQYGDNPHAVLARLVTGEAVSFIVPNDIHPQTRWRIRPGDLAVLNGTLKDTATWPNGERIALVRVNTLTGWETQGQYRANYPNRPLWPGM